MKIEILYPEMSNIYGDYGNIMFLKKCLPDAEFIETELHSEPAFVKQDINLVYLGSMTEKAQEIIIRSLKPYKDKLNEYIQTGKAILFTGNSLEILGKYIENDDETKIEGLGILDIYSKREMFNRYNSLFLGEFKNIKIVGFKDQFAHSYGNNETTYFAKVIRGAGLNRESKLEGIRINNFIGTSILGPILVLNPEFAKFFVHNILGQTKAKIPFEKAAYESYEARLKEYEDMRRSI